jgi:hypothetical protein
MDSYYCGIEEKRVYVREGKTWQCILCTPGKGIKSEQERENHASTPNHRANVVKTLELLGKKYAHRDCRIILRRNSNVVDLESSVDQLQSLNWKLQVQGVLYRYMKLDTCSASDEASLLGDVKALIQKYEQMERLSLLELAVWKAACISRAGQEEVDSKTSIKTLHDAILWVANNHHTWKKYRKEMRKSNAIEIVIQHVLPFLGKPNLIQYFPSCGVYPHNTS